MYPTVLTAVTAVATIAKVAEQLGYFNKETPAEPGKAAEAAEKPPAYIDFLLSRISKFNGSGYETWSKKMKTLFMCQDLWDLVERGYTEEELTVEDFEYVRKRDAAPLLLIQLSIDESIFSCIANAKTSKQAWDALEKKYKGKAPEPTLKKVEDESVSSCIVDATKLKEALWDPLYLEKHVNESVLSSPGVCADASESKGANAKGGNGGQQGGNVNKKGSHGGGPGDGDGDGQPFNQWGSPGAVDSEYINNQWVPGGHDGQHFNKQGNGEPSNNNPRFHGGGFRGAGRHGGGVRGNGGRGGGSCRGGGRGDGFHGDGGRGGGGRGRGDGFHGYGGRGGGFHGGASEGGGCGNGGSRGGGRGDGFHGYGGRGGGFHGGASEGGGCGNGGSRGGFRGGRGGRFFRGGGCGSGDRKHLNKDGGCGGGFRGGVNRKHFNNDGDYGGIKHKSFNVSSREGTNDGCFSPKNDHKGADGQPFIGSQGGHTSTHDECFNIERSVFGEYNSSNPKMESISSCTTDEIKLKEAQNALEQQHESIDEMLVKPQDGSTSNGMNSTMDHSHEEARDLKCGGRTIFINNLDMAIDDKMLHNFFSALGNILSCKVVTYESGASKGYGYIEYDSEEAARKAIEKMDGAVLNCKQVRVKYFVSKQGRGIGVKKTKLSPTNVFVGNLSQSTSEDDLRNAFHCFGGTISSVVLMRDGDGKSKGYGFVHFKDADDAAWSVEVLNGHKFDDKVWQVRRAFENNFVGKAKTKSVGVPVPSSTDNGTKSGNPSEKSVEESSTTHATKCTKPADESAHRQFNGSGYETWSNKMKTLFMYRDLWDLVERGYTKEELTVEEFEYVRKRDAAPLLLIQLSIDESIFSCIANAKTSKQAWDALEKKYKGKAPEPTLKKVEDESVSKKLKLKTHHITAIYIDSFGVGHFHF